MLSIRRILFPTDFSESSNQALKHALFLAREHGAELDVLHVIRAMPGYPEMGVPDMKPMGGEEARQHMRNQFESIEGHGAVNPQFVIEEETNVGRAILDYAERRDADLIVLGTHGRQGVRRLLLGSEAEEVLRGAKQPVLAIRKQDPPFPAASIRRILVPVDLSDHSTAALTHAREMAVVYDAEVAVVHVVDPELRYPSVYAELTGETIDSTLAIEPAVQGVLDEMTSSVQEAGVETHIHIGHGNPAQYITDFAETHDADLTVLSSHGHSGLERFLVGSVAEKVMRTANCPVFIVKSFGKMIASNSGAAASTSTPESE